MGMSMVDSTHALSLDLPSLVWKTFAKDPITLSDLRAIDQSTAHTIDTLRNPHKHDLTSESFDYVFPEMYFTAVSSSGVEVELLPNGSSLRVTFENCGHYANLLEQYKINEFSRQIGALCRGLASVVPFLYLSVFTWQQLEVAISGNPDIDIDLLKDKTDYRGNLSSNDRHVRMFWNVLGAFSTENKQKFLQFVWGRNRLPVNAVGFGKEMFKLSDHLPAILSRRADYYLPVSHTCFFALELPRYSTEDVMRERLLYAINNCTTVDADATHEGRANMQMRSQNDTED